MNFIQNLCAQFPVDLAPNEISDTFIYQVEQDNEFLLTLTASANTNWSLQDSESATLVVAVDGDWDNYNQDIVLYAGDTNHYYYVSLGSLDVGLHSIEFKFDYNKSSIGAEIIHIEEVAIYDTTDSYIGTVDSDVWLHSPILYGRDLLSWNESTHTDIPLALFYQINEIGNNKKITYSMIFSNEDSRVGLGLADLMFSYGRTTDIEWMYEVTLDANGDIISEIFQGPSHTTTNFNGNKIGRHPILKNATLNCNFTDTGISDYKFQLMPYWNIDLNPREWIMDAWPWTYRLMGEELINEDRYEEEANPATVEMSDIRNYVYIGYNGISYGENDNLALSISFFDDCMQYLNTHGLNQFEFPYNGGYRRTSIELPANFNAENISKLSFLSNGLNEFQIQITDIDKFFYLDSNYMPIDIPINFEQINIDNANPNEWIYTLNLSNVDCLGEENGIAECDDCEVCNGGNNDIDDCGICFGNNMNMDCSGTCFGFSQLDECGICDDDASNNNLTCSGCTDINAENFDENAIFHDGSCTYSDNIFFVPTEYTSIQNAIFFASNGDTVEVGEGIYQENIHFLDKSITVRSMAGLEVQPTIEGVDSLSTITIENSIDVSLIGFTITNGYGRGVSFDDFLSLAADPVAFDSLITNVLRGGGVSIINSSPYLKNLHITNNSARNVGAGIGLINSSATIESTVIDNNIIPDGDALGGGGIAVNGGSSILLDVQISNNYVGTNMYYLNGGGGILCGFSFEDSPLSLNVYNTTIFNNTANIGAGIGALSGNIFIEKTLISSNSGDFGAALSMGEPLGLVVDDINMNLVNSTVVNNIGDMTVGLINSANLNILNSIFWHNDGVFASMPNNNQLNIEGVYSLFENDFNGEGNIVSDPLFEDSESNNYELTVDSPCIDSGIDYFDFNNGVSVEINLYVDSSPDMGAYEFNPTTQDCETSLGDVNLDGVLDILDIFQIVNIIMGFSEPSEQQVCLADINEDNSLDIFDIIIMINIILTS